MHPDPAYESLPSTSLEHRPGVCPSCGFQAEPDSETCPRCQTTLPGQAKPAAADPSPTTYVEQTISCTPEELEALARREAVDGWTLVDTIVDEDRPDRLKANFRRAATATEAAPRQKATKKPRRSSPAKAKAPAKTKPQPAAGKPKASGAAPAKARHASAPHPRLGPGSDDDSAVFWAVMLLSAVVLMQGLGFPGIFVTLFAVPGAARRISRMPKAAALVLGFVTAFLISAISWPGLFVALYALPGVIQNLFDDWQ